MTTSKVIPVTIVPIFNPIIPGLSAPPPPPPGRIGLRVFL